MGDHFFTSEDSGGAAAGEKLIEALDLRVAFSPRGGRGFGAPEKAAALRAVDGVSLFVRQGEILAVVGESGSGKTTFGKALLNIVPATAGRVLYGGRDLLRIAPAEMRRLRRKLQMIFQDPYESLDPRQNAYQTLLEPLRIHCGDLPASERDQLIYQRLDAVGLHPAREMAERYPHNLSGGQRQRLSIASAMILEPDFVVADEPVSMLDVSVRAEILRLMLDMQADRALSYLFITHDISLAWMIADRAAVFYLGSLVEIGPAQQVVHACLHPYTMALISVVPAMAGTERPKQRRILAGETPSPSAVPEGCRFHPRCWRYRDKGDPEICRAPAPALREAGDGHSAACHFFL
jgi:oligopeptide/dipeptide ABC transporter ATP-binding protein